MSSDAEDIPAAHVRVRPLVDGEVEFVCTHCLRKRDTRATQTERDFRRAAHDFLIRHRSCKAPVLQ